MKRFLILFSLVFTLSCTSNDKSDVDDTIRPASSGIAAPANLGFSVLAQYPHDTSAYTQGLELYKGKMYEATGDYETSSLRITDHKTGKVEQKHPMGSDKIFGEGITIFNGKIYQLTWQSNVVYVYDVANIKKPIKTFTWPYEGWGITHNGTDLIVSDGTANLYFVNPEDFKLKNTLGVQTDKGPLDNLNELEFVDGFIYANVYQTNVIVKIDPESGHVVGMIDFPANFKAEEDAKNPGRADVLNGIAYDSTSKSFFLTGKRWSKMFEVKLN
jgi:glutamine cyclotransferase